MLSNIETLRRRAFGQEQPFATDRFRIAMHKYLLGMNDRLGTPIEVGALVRVDRCGRSYRWHPEFRKAYRKIAGQVLTAVGRDASSGIHVALGAEGVLTLEPGHLKVVGRAGHPVAALARRMWLRTR